MKTVILTLVISLIVAVVAILQFSGRFYQLAFMRPSNDSVSRAALLGIAAGFEAAGIPPPKDGYEEHSDQTGERSIRVQYVDGKPAVIGAGPDGVFGTPDDMIVHYEIE